MKNILITSLLATALAGFLEGTAKAERLHITVYDKSDFPVQVTHRVAENLRAIFLQANIEIDWVTGTPDADESTLVNYTNIVSKEQERRLACRARRDLAVAILPAAPSRVPQTVLGFALPFASQGINVQVYKDRIAAAALAKSVPESDLLAHAIAHEIGHVLLRSSAHAAGGLMAGIWKAREYSWIATGSMFFTPSEAKGLRASMKGEGCPVLSSFAGLR